MRTTTIAAVLCVVPWVHPQVLRAEAPQTNTPTTTNRGTHADTRPAPRKDE